MAGMIPPLDLNVVFEDNASQGGCCSTFDDDAHVVFDHRTNKFKSKTRSISIFNNVQCCVQGEQRQERNNRRQQERNIDQQNLIDGYFQEQHGISLADVKRILDLDLHETSPVTVVAYEAIRNYAKTLPPKDEMASTSQVMTAPDIMSSEGNTAPARKLVLVRKKGSSAVPPLVNWKRPQHAHSSEDPHVITSRMMTEIAEMYSGDIETLPAKQIVAAVQYRIEQEQMGLQEKHLRAEWEQRMADSIIRKLSEQGEQIISPRKIRALVGQLDNEVLQMYENEEQELPVSQVLLDLQKRQKEAEEQMLKCQEQGKLIQKLGMRVSRRLSPLRDLISQKEAVQLITDSLDDLEASVVIPVSETVEMQLAEVD